MPPQQRQQELLALLSAIPPALLGAAAAATDADHGLPAVHSSSPALAEALLIAPLRSGLGSAPPPFITLEAAVALLSLLEPEGRSQLLAIARGLHRPPSPLLSRALPRGPSLRVLVTGATGFLGGAVAQLLAATGAEVTATGRDESKAPALLAVGAARFVRAELSLPEEAAGLCAGQHAVVHCAALCGTWPPVVAEAWGGAAHTAANVDATANLLAGCAAAGVARFVHVSTPSLYVSNGRGSLAEECGVGGIPEWAVPPRHLAQPSCYAASKLQAERLVQAAAGGGGAGRGGAGGGGAGGDAAVSAGLVTVVLRPRAIFGVGDQHLLPRLLASLRAGRLPVTSPRCRSRLLVASLGHISRCHVSAPGEASRRALGRTRPHSSRTHCIPARRTGVRRTLPPSHPRGPAVPGHRPARGGRPHLGERSPPSPSPHTPRPAHTHPHSPPRRRSETSRTPAHSRCVRPPLPSPAEPSTSQTTSQSCCGV